MLARRWWWPGNCRGDCRIAAATVFLVGFQSLEEGFVLVLCVLVEVLMGEVVTERVLMEVLLEVWVVFAVEVWVVFAVVVFFAKDVYVCVLFVVLLVHLLPCPCNYSMVFGFVAVARVLFLCS